MAVTNFNGGFMFDTVGDAVLGLFSIQTLIIKKVTNPGSITFGDVNNTTSFVTPVIAGSNTVVPIVFNPPWNLGGFRLKAIGSGTAEVTVIYALDRPRFTAAVTT